VSKSPQDESIAIRAEINRLMNLQFESIHYDVLSRIGILNLPEGQCTDMSGAIKFFKNIDSKVRFIFTFSGEKIDTAYGQINKEWHAWKAQEVLDILKKAGVANSSEREMIDEFISMNSFAVAEIDSNVGVGRFFHSFKDGKVQWQGVVLNVIGSVCLVQLFSWLTGDDSNQVEVYLDETKNWSFYDSNEEMLRAFMCFRKAGLSG